MRQIDIATWPRRQQFEMFNSFDYPHFGLCAQLDLTAFVPYVRDEHLSLNLALIYVIASAANDVPEFRYRIRAEKVVEHDVVHPSSTIMSKGDRFGFCLMPYMPDYGAFALQAAERVSATQEAPLLEESDEGRDDLLFLSSIPWLSFTSVVHPIHMHPVDSVPRLTWGKFLEEGQRIQMPLSVQAHHALMDGVHMARLYERVQGYLDEPASILAGHKSADR